MAYEAHIANVPARLDHQEEEKEAARDEDFEVAMAVAQNIPNGPIILADIKHLNDTLNQLMEIIRRLTEFRVVYVEYMQYVDLLGNHQGEDLRQIEQTINQARIQQL